MKKTFFIMLAAALMGGGGVQAQSTKQTHKVHENPTIVADAPLFDALLLPFRGKTVLVDIWATWCGPCKMVGPIIDELAEEYGDSVVIGKCDVDSCDDIVSQYKVRNIPTVVFIKGGEVVDKVVGATSKETLKAKVDALL